MIVIKPLMLCVLLAAFFASPSIAKGKSDGRDFYKILELKKNAKD